MLPGSWACEIAGRNTPHRWPCEESSEGHRKRVDVPGSSQIDPAALDNRYIGPEVMCIQMERSRLNTC